MRLFLLGCLGVPLAFLLAWPKADVLQGADRIAVAANKARMAISYEKEIEPILLKRCKQCHGEGEERKGNFNVTSYEFLMRGGQGGKAVKPGKSGESLMIRMMLGQQKPFMPPGIEEPVPINDILLIRKWIDQGAPGPGKKQ